MLYKPKYCCNCGERIERINWTVFSSRKFCELCETEYKFDEILPKAIAVILLGFGFWGFGSLFIVSDSTLTIEKTNQTQNSSPNIKRSLKSSSLQDESESFGYNLNDKENTSTKNPKQESSVTTESKKNLLSKDSLVTTNVTEGKQKKTDEPVYFCGAETKKGTPCSRRVKGGGRCWQHKNREAIVPTKQLLAEEQ